MYVVGMNTEDGQGRFARDYTDEGFYGLPYIREFGCVAPGFFALHFKEGESVETSERAGRVAQMPFVVIGTSDHLVYADAELLLLNFERAALAACADFDIAA